MFNAISNLFKGIGLLDIEKGLEEAYYNGAQDNTDLERRMREVQQGRAPWQKKRFM